MNHVWTSSLKIFFSQILFSHSGENINLFAASSLLQVQVNTINTIVISPLGNLEIKIFYQIY